MKKLLISLFSMLAMSFSVHATEARIEAYKAPFHVGETVMACGKVAQVSQGKKSQYLNLDKSYPNQTLTILIWNRNLNPFEERFGKLDNLEDQKICVRGKITEYKNKLQIQVSNPQYLRLME
ncbi:hypothetical protein [Vibrio sp. B1Z05]|uniref:hypothetical protein n=1 Tax=Vibrio sp. B1Z05 TaxID=2654980 RepID=UPI00128C872B|nr:hypothetical protein [Vibrio sp. B1Z05]MPW36440.1 hypothetical protein [Vibrio sp. B1Z05]